MADGSAHNMTSRPARRPEIRIGVAMRSDKVSNRGKALGKKVEKNPLHHYLSRCPKQNDRFDVAQAACAKGADRIRA